MKPLTSIHRFVAAFITILGLLQPSLGTATPVDVSKPRTAIPPNVVTTSNRPMMMLATTKDHSLFGPIYTDFEDLDGDGIIDTTFKPTFKYYGYFDPTKCYEYNVTSSQFNPITFATIVSTLVGAQNVDRYTCLLGVSQWSGNFLNWASMTRLDIVRKMLYGGTRSTDTSTATVLERAKLNWDAHSFTKYYKGLDIRDYTPFATTDLIKTTGSNANVYAGLTICNMGATDASNSTPVMRMVKGNVRFWSTVEIQLCQWRETYSSGTFGPKLATYYKDADKGNGGIAHEVTIPSKATDGATYNAGLIGPELTMRVKVCDATLLGEEHCQAFPPSSTTNFKPYGLFQEFGFSGTGGAARAEFGVISGSYDLNHTAGALRKNMGDFADEINPTTGVFCHSASSGCATTLAAPDSRTTGNGAIKSIDAFTLYGRSPNTYGGGNAPSSSGEGNLPAWGNPVGEMLVQALQYYAFDGTTAHPSTNPTSTSNDSAAGLPVISWKDPLSNSNATRTALYGNAICRPMHTLALSSSALSFDGQAATPFTTLNNRANGTLDVYTNLVGTEEGLAGTLRSIGSVSGQGLTTADDKNSCSAKTLGGLYNVNGICPEAPAMGGTYQAAGAALYGNTSKIRTIATPPSDLITVKDALKVKTLAASLTGGSPRIDVPVPNTNPQKYVYITPESVINGGGVSAPLTFASINSYQNPVTFEGYGSFIVTWNDILMGGDYDMDITGFLRYDIVINTASPSGYDIKITSDIPGVCGGAAGTHGFSVIGVQKAGVSANGRYLTHQHYNSGKLTGMPPTSEYLCGDDTYRANIMTYPTTPLSPATVASNTPISPTPSTSETYATTVCNVTGDGTTKDPGIPNLPAYCTVKPYAYPVSMSFNMVGETSALIRDPLWYAAKYGYFKSSTKNSDGTYTEVPLPNVDQNTWDSVNADGTSGSDGIPDGYFLARRPDLLEAQLRRALNDVTGKSNASPATSSTRLVSGGYKYVVSFDPNTFDGNIEAYAVNQDGDFYTSPTFRAGQLLGCRTNGPCTGITADAGNTRSIITNSGNGASAGVKFRWASLPVAYKTQMTTASNNVLTTTNAQAALDYIRGDQSKELTNQLRQRGTNPLGPIVSSTPWIQPVPSANYFGSAYKGYTDFATNNKDRKKLLWAGANDGMLHAFNPGSGTDTGTSSDKDSNAGKEVFAYIPGMLANRLAEIPLQRSSALTTLNGAPFVTGTESRPDDYIWSYVDGSPFTGDVRLGAESNSNSASDWRTYLFSSLGRGGRGVFALDTTNYAFLESGEGNAASIFKWQFTMDDDIDMGYLVNEFSMNNSTRQPMPIAKLNNGKFAYLIGNGNKSANGKAVLYILFVDGPSGALGAWISGTDYIKLEAEAGSGNGLSQVTWLDVDSNGTADAVYAGDLKGNMWKFDLSATSPLSWKVAYKSGVTNQPLFTAKSGATGTGAGLPITTAPEYAYGPFDGPVILFGTGNAFEALDYPNTSVNQRIYGIWDRPAFSYTTGSRTLPSDLSTLAARTYTRDSDGNVKITGTAADVDWTSQDGWYVTLPGDSEMLVSDPDLRARVLVFTTIRPPSTTATCTTRPDVSLFAIDPLSGTAKRRVLGSTTSGTTVTASVGTGIQDQKIRVTNDATSRSFKTTVSCVAGTAGCTCVGTKCTKSVASTCTNGQKSPRIVGETTDKSLCFNTSPRQQWREIPGLRTDR